MKRAFYFHFVDEPQFVAAESRAWIAHALRCYRKQPRYKLERIAAHVYRVRTVGSSAVALLTIHYPQSRAAVRAAYEAQKVRA